MTVALIGTECNVILSQQMPLLRQTQENISGIFQRIRHKYALLLFLFLGNRLQNMLQ